MKDTCKKNRIQLGKKDTSKSKEDFFIGSKIKLRVLFKIKFLLKIHFVLILIKKKNL